MDNSNSFRKHIEESLSGDLEVSVPDKIFGFGNGFGYRTRSPRSESPDGQKELQENFVNYMEYFRWSPNEIHTHVENDVGIAWGVFTEDFQMKGRNPEKNAIRFSMTCVLDEDGQWRELIGHRDIQEFDSNDLYHAKIIESDA